MRSILVILAIAALVVVALMFTGLLKFHETSPAIVQAPKFQADVATVSMGIKNETVKVPTITLKKPDQQPQ